MRKQVYVMAFYRCEVCEDVYAIDGGVTEEPACPYCGQTYCKHLKDQEISLPAKIKRIK